MISYNVALYTSNRHPFVARARATGSLPVFSPFLFTLPLITVASLSLPRRTLLTSPFHTFSRKTRRNPLPLSRTRARAISDSLKNHNTSFFFFVFFTQATRYSLVILLIDTSSFSSFFLSSSASSSSILSAWTREGLARKYHRHFPLLSSPQSFGKSPPPPSFNPPPRAGSLSPSHSDSPPSLRLSR